MKRYPKYKDSGISWLGQIPEHWEVKQLRSFLKLFSEKGHGDSQLLSVTREQGVIQRDVESKEENHNYIPEDLSGYKYIEKGDFVINKMKAWQGSYAVSDYDGIVSPAYYTCKLSGVNSRFFTMAIRSKVYVSFFAQYSKGIRVGQWDLETEALKAIPFYFPPLNEQQKIVEFLDSKISKIESYISEKEKEVKLLTELKQSQIAQVVTKGINPNVPMKDSGISWIGQIPEHWDIRRLKTLVSCNDETLSENTHPTTEIKYVEIGDVDAVNGIKNFSIYKFKDAPSRARRVTRKDDVIISTVRTYLKAIAQIKEEELVVSTGFAVLRPLNINASYMAFATQCDGFTSDVLRHSIGIAYPAITATNLLKLKIPLPPLEEQKAIVEYINTKCQSIDSMISNLESEIAYLKEYKQSLIADAVTGAINVQ